MASTVKLTFHSISAVNESIAVYVNTGVSVENLFETFVTTRSGKGQSTIGADLTTHVENFRTAWNLDYKDYGGSNNLVSGPGLAVPDSTDIELTITLEDNTWQFDSVSGSAVTSGAISYTISNDPVQDPKSLSLDSYTGGDCNNGTSSYSATGASSYNVYVDGVLTSDAVTSPFTLSLPRGSSKVVRVTDLSGNLIGEVTARTPRRLISNDLSVQIANFESGATVTISTTFISTSIEPYTYSIGGAFQESNVFSGIAEGNYTLTVKDAWGCDTTKSFTVDGVTELTETVFSISDINALRFAKVEDGKKNFKNTLSSNELKKVKYPFLQQFPEGYSIPTQFKTNAQYLNVFTINEEGATTALTPIKKTQNTGLEAKSTCTYFSLGGGRSAVYFGVVDMLDPLTDAVLETVDYGFTLPEWANTKGNYVTLEGVGQIQIAEIGYSDFYEAFVLEFEVSYSGDPVTKTIYSRYNLQPYEVYEFSTPVSQDKFHVCIEAGRSESEIEFTYLSEKIKKVTDSDKLYEITYYDSKNKGGMVYATGIRHKLWLEGYHQDLGEQKTEGYDGDQEYYVTDNTVYRSEQFYFIRLSPEMAHKLRLVVAHDRLYINNILYKISDSPEKNSHFINNSRTFSVSLKSGGELFLESDQEIISGSAESEVISGAIEASKGKSLLLWTKTNG